MLSRSVCMCIMAVVLLMGSVAFGQVSSTGVILGSTSDPSGALIPGVTITATNQGSNQVRQSITNETGNYRIEPLQVGRYTVTAELPGFRKEVSSEVQVDVDARVRLDFHMQVGAVDEVINVQGTAPLLQTDDSEMGALMDLRNMEEIPLNGRNFSQLAYLSPGTFAPRPGSHLGYRGGFVSEGMDERGNQYLLDGVNNNGAYTMEIGFFPNVDSIAEFKQQEQNYGAQYGRYAGSQVNAVTKSGTNEFHGSAFGFDHLSALDTRNYFDPTLASSQRSELFLKQYGGVLGGPIIHDKLFFFASFQGQRQIQNQATQPTVPFPEYWSGDLSRLNKVIRDPLTGQPFPNSQIPLSRISPVALNFRPIIPAPVRNTFTNNADSIIPIPENYTQPTIKIDSTFKQHHQVIGSWNLFDAPQNLEWQFAGSPAIPGEAINGPIKNQLVSLQYIWSVSPTLINELRSGLVRVNRDRRNEVADKNYTQLIGINGTAADYTPLGWGYPKTTVSGYSTFGTAGSNEPLRVDGNFSISDMISTQKGNHAIKIGGDFYKQYGKHQSLNPASFSFNGFATGDAFADFLLGYISTDSRTIPTLDASGNVVGGFFGNNRRKSTNWFFQDDWKARQNLTISFGLRYELTIPLEEVHNKLAAFDPTIGGGVGGLRLAGSANTVWEPAAIAAYQARYPGLLIAYTNTPRLTQVDPHDFAPRFGLAWTPGFMANTVIHTGYGIFFQLDDLCNCAYSESGPWVTTETYTSANNPTFANPWPINSIAGGAISATGLDPHLTPIYYGEWNLDIQHQLPGAFVMDVSYVGKKGSHVDGNRDINQPINGAKPYPLFSAPMAVKESRASSIYHALQMNVERRSSKGLTVTASFVWSKLLGDGSDEGIAATNEENSYNLHNERGPGLEDAPYRYHDTLLYDLPVGHGRRFLSGASGVADAILGGWQFSTVGTANSGSPATAYLGVDYSGTGRAGIDRPNAIGNPNLSHPSPTTGWWNKAAFVLPPTGTIAAPVFGNAGVGTLRNPGYFSMDGGLMKHIHVGDKGDLQFRWEVFNALNHTNFLQPGTTQWDSSTFGVISAALPSRSMQLALKYIF